MGRFNWDTWTNFDDYREDDKGECEIVGVTPPPSSTTISPSSTPKEIIKAPPRIETFLIMSSFDNDFFIESGYLNVN